MSALTAIGQINTSQLSGLFSTINGDTIRGISTGQSCVTVFGEFSDITQSLVEIHKLGYFKAVTSRSNIGMIEVLHPIFIDSPGWVAKITSSLASQGINLIEVTTGKATVNLFVDEGKLLEAVTIMRDLFAV